MAELAEVVQVPAMPAPRRKQIFVNLPAAIQEDMDKVVREKLGISLATLGRKLFIDYYASPSFGALKKRPDIGEALDLDESEDE